jgi:hypothetical protein
MTLTTYDPAMTMREARDVYFAVNGFGDNGGYDDAWVNFKLGPIPFPFPNTKGRIRAVKVHDLHHLLTAYDTDIVGEFEISAWEIGAGCKDFFAAWFLNLGGMAGGAMFAPRRTFRAFLRGLDSKSLYGLQYEGLLDKTVAELRSETHADRSLRQPSVTDYVAFGAAAATGGVLGTLFLAVGIVLAPVAVAYSAMASKSALVAPQSGHVQSSGSDSKAVPGAIPVSGSPMAGS